MARERFQPLRGQEMLHADPPHPLPVGAEGGEGHVAAAVREVHGGERPWAGGEHVVLLEEDLADGVGIVGGDGVDAAELQVHQWAVLFAEFRHVAVGEVG